jgi:hypothetical protein
MAAKPLKPGDRVSTPGVYLVLHDNLHRCPDRELYPVGSRLPECEACGAAVRYQLEAPCVPLQAEAALSLATA